ncbi:MAG: class I SAM-dependent methyltransferase [Planctomycetota bacterium]
MRKLIYDLMANAHRNAAIRQIRDLESKLPSPASRFAVPFVFKGQGHFRKIKPKQNPTEIEAMYHTLCDLKPQRVLEIGTARGGSLYLWSQAATDDATLVSVDLPGGDYGGAYPDCRTPFYQSFARPEQTMHLHRADSHQPASLDLVKQDFGDQPIDYAFIDGDHLYEGVKQDFEMYGPLVRPGGLIGFHDTQPRPQQPTIQVDRLWREIVERYPDHTQEFVGPGRAIGIGLLRVPETGLQLT